MEGRHWLDSLVAGMPSANSAYRAHSARIKRAWCLALHRVGLLRPSSFVAWVATRRCNLSCPYCEAGAGTADPGELTTPEVRRLLDDLRRMRVRRWLISGGEPALRADLPELIAYGERLGIAPGLLSNGWLVEERWAELKPFRYFLYMTSLDGPPDFHDRMRGGRGSFRRAMRALELFAAAGVPHRVVKTVVYPENVRQLPALAAELADAGATDWHLTPPFACGRACGEARFELSPSGLETLVEFVRGHRGGRRPRIDLDEAHSYLNCVAGCEGDRPFFCGAGLTRCTVMPNGDVLACGQVYEHAPPEGNVRQTPLSRIWKQGFTSVRSGTQSVECRACEHWGACQGGCWAERQIGGSCLKPLWEKTCRE